MRQRSFGRQPAPRALDAWFRTRDDAIPCSDKMSVPRARLLDLMKVRCCNPQAHPQRAPIADRRLVSRLVASSSRPPSTPRGSGPATRSCDRGSRVPPSPRTTPARWPTSATCRRSLRSWTCLSMTTWRRTGSSTSPRWFPSCRGCCRRAGPLTDPCSLKARGKGAPAKKKGPAGMCHPPVRVDGRGLLSRLCANLVARLIEVKGRKK